MVKGFNTLVLLLALAGLIGCSSSNSKPLLIKFSADSTSILISNIDKPGLLELKRISADDSLYRGLIAVLQTPSERDTAIREEPVDGSYMTTDSNVVFTPLLPFVVGRDYLVITHLNSKFGDVKDIAKGTLNTAIKPAQKLLSR